MNRISFYSTNHQAPHVDLKTALLHGQAPDRGLYMPEHIPVLSHSELAAIQNKDYAEIAFTILNHFTTGIVEPSVLEELCVDAYDYAVPVEPVFDRVHVLRLDRGPTASFKDFAARMMARLIGRFVREDKRTLTILTATSGDTGSAVASAFHRVEGIRVLVLFPYEEVSDRQRKQMTTLSDNIRTIAVNGKFDDCQALVKRAFADPSLSGLPLSSANSINIGRLLPQSVYYIYAASRIAEVGESIVVAVPSGNFGNMMGCVLAKQMGLAVRKLVIPVNENDEFPVFLDTKCYQKIEPSRNCLSNAMNVGHPSNLARLVDLYGGWMDEKGIIHREPNHKQLEEDIYSTSVSDQETCQTIKEAWNTYHLLLEPHGAVGWKGLQNFLAEYNEYMGAPMVALETAHPAKFPEEIEKQLGFQPEVPESLAKLDQLTEDYDEMDASYDAFHDYLLKHYQ